MACPGLVARRSAVAAVVISVWVSGGRAAQMTS